MIPVNRLATAKAMLLSKSLKLKAIKKTWEDAIRLRLRGHRDVDLNAIADLLARATANEQEAQELVTNHQPPLPAKEAKRKWSRNPTS